jgi:hypothetical protein
MIVNLDTITFDEVAGWTALIGGLLKKFVEK